MHALFVHGMGRTPLSGLPLLRRLRKCGLSTSTFFYSVTFQDFPSIETRLRRKVIQIASQDEYVLVGHSLGGIIIRSVLASLPSGTRMPNRVFLMGSPVRPSRIAKYLSRNWLFWLATRDCGNLLSSEERMRGIAPCPVPTTSFVGTRGIRGKISPFGDEVNDGVVTASEVSAHWISEALEVPVVHSFMPSNKRISELIIERVTTDRKLSADSKIESMLGPTSTRRRQTLSKNPTIKGTKSFSLLRTQYHSRRNTFQRRGMRKLSGSSPIIQARVPRIVHSISREW